jgi:Spy/CpxP family protein refolding chaperone
VKSTRRIILLLIIVPVLTLGAGVVAGMLASRLPAANPGLSPRDRTLLVSELDLTAGQRDQMRQIWENVRAKDQRIYEQAEDLQAKREQALISLLTDEQKAKFQTISKDFAARRTGLDKTRDQVFQDAVDASKALMNPTQQKAYDSILEMSHVGPLDVGG